jgi:Neuraminidase (sialidase)
LSAAPSLAVSGTNVHVAYLNDALHWGHNDLYYRRSTDNGVTWNAPLQLATLRSVQLRETADIPRSVFQPSVTASGTDVHLFYRSQPAYFENQALYYASSADNGVTWAAERRLTWGGRLIGLMPKASAAAGDNVYVAYSFEAPPSYADDIYFKQSTDAGVTWSAPVRLTYLDSVSQPASLIYSPGTGYFHLVFRFLVDQDTYFYEIYYKRGH